MMGKFEFRDLTALNTIDISNCKKCAISRNKVNKITKCFGIFGDRKNLKNRDIVYMFIAIAPSYKRIESPFPPEAFRSKLGVKFTRNIKKAGIDLKTVYITNMLKCSTHLNRKTIEQERINCYEWLWKEIQIIGPKVIICVGQEVRELLRAPDVGNFCMKNTGWVDDVIYTTIHHPNYCYSYYGITEKNYLKEFKAIKTKVCKWKR